MDVPVTQAMEVANTVKESINNNTLEDTDTTTEATQLHSGYQVNDNVKYVFQGINPSFDILKSMCSQSTRSSLSSTKAPLSFTEPIAPVYSTTQLLELQGELHWSTGGGQ